MPTQRTELHQRLFQLRLEDGFHDENGKDSFPDLLESLRPHLKGDERIKVALLKCGPLAEMLMDGRAVMELLLDELPDSPEARFILNYNAFQPLGEDGMATQSAHRIMAERCADDPWFRRQVIQFARGRYLGYYHSDLSESDGRLLLRWGLMDVRYLPRCLNGFSMDEVLLLLCKHPDFPLDEYDFAGSWAVLPRLFLGARSLAAEAERLGFFASCKELDRSGQGRLLDIIAEGMQPGNVLVLREVADDPQQPATSWARLLLLKCGTKSPVALDWVRNHLASQTEDQWWLGMLASYAPDARWTLDATRKLLDQPDKGFRDSCATRGVARLCGNPWRLPVEEGLPLLQQVLADSSLAKEHPALLLALARAYPDHPDTRELLTARGALDALREVEGLTADLVKLTLKQVQLGTISRGATSILRDCGEEIAFRALADLAEHNSSESVQASALRALAEGYGHRPEVKPLLIKHATLDEKRETVWRQALLALARNHPDDPDTLATLQRLADGGLRQSYRSREVLDYLADPDYRIWLASREERRAELETKLRSARSDDRGELHAAAYQLALWFGDQQETVELLLGRVLLDQTSATPLEARESSWQAGRLAEARVAAAVGCLRLAVMRWPGDLRVQEAVKAALKSPALRVREEAACLLSRAYSEDPQTVPLLRALIGTSPVIFGEYLGLRMGEPEAMSEGLAVLQRLAEEGYCEPLALDGPLHLLRHFGPRKDLFGILARLGVATRNTALQKGISRAFDHFFPGRMTRTLDAPIATDRIEALQMADATGADHARLKAMSEGDPSELVRLSAAEALFLRGPRESLPVEAVKDLIRKGCQQAIPLLGRMCPGDEAVLGWLLDVLSANQTVGAAASPWPVMTETVAKSYAQIPRGRNYLVERIREAREVAEFSTAVRALCASYHQDADVRTLLDSRLLDSRLDGPTASELLKTQTAQWPSSRKIDFYLSIINDPKAPPTCEAQRIAPIALAGLIACKCHGEIAPADPEAKRIVAALTKMMEGHSRETVRLHAMSALVTAISGSGSGLDGGFELYPEAQAALRRWWAKPDGQQ